MLFAWNNSYSVNIAEIDAQHKKLLEIGSRLYDVAVLNDNYDHYDEIIQAVNALKDYTVYHFGYEEKLMEAYQYPGLEFQQIQHSFFIKKLEKMLNKDIDDEQQRTMTDLISFIADWVVNHIAQSDMKYKEFFNEKGVL